MSQRLVFVTACQKKYVEERRAIASGTAGESSIGRAIENAGRVFGIVPWSIAQILCLLFLSLGNLYPRRNSLGNARGCFSRFFDQR